MRPLLLVLPLALVACTTTRPVEIGGYERDLAALAGDWTGTFRSEEGVRYGDLTFHLTAGADVATGHVVMYRTGIDPAPPPITIPVRFVWTADEEVEGCLTPYRDPILQVEVETCFQGNLEDDQMGGTYETRGTETAIPAHLGRWSARRTGA